MLDELDQPEPPEEQARIYMDKNYDYQQFRTMKKQELLIHDAIPPAGVGAPAPAAPSILQEDIDGRSGSSRAKRCLKRGRPTEEAADVFDNFDEGSSSTSNSATDLSPSLLRTKKKQRPSTSSKVDGKTSAGGGSSGKTPSEGTASKAVHEGEEHLWSPKLVIIKSEWLDTAKLGEPTFNDIAKYLNSDEGITWRKGWEIYEVATAKKLLEW